MTKITSALRRMFQAEHGRAWLMGGVALLVVLLAIQGVKYYWIGRLERTLTGSVEHGVQGPSKRKPAKAEKDYNAIAEKGMLGSAEKKEPPKFSLWGILGEEALLGANADSANPFKVGAKLPSGEEVVRIGVNDVVLSKDGKERTLYVHDALKPGKDSKPSPNGPPSPAPSKPEEIGPAPAEPGVPTEKPPAEPPEVESKNKQTVPEAAEVDMIKLQAGTEAAEAIRLKIMEARGR